MDPSQLKKLSPESTLADLPTYSFRVEPETSGQVVAQQFKAQPQLPGVVIMADQDLIGVISQAKFFERMSQRFSLELYLKRPIQLLPEVATPTVAPLVLPSSCKIGPAVESALGRPSSFAYEPILIRQKDGIYLLDLHDVLLAQTKILGTINKFIEKQHQQTRQLLESLKVEQARTKEYATRLEEEQSETQRVNQILENQQQEMRQQAKRITRLNHRFINISQLLSSEGKKAFEATFIGVSAISKDTDRVFRLGELLERDLEIVDQATHQIEHVSRQVKHLALQASLIVSRSGGQITGFDFITNEINKLGNQAVIANQQVDEIANRFRQRIREVIDAAQSGERTAQSLIQEIQQAETALAQLEALVNEQEGYQGAASLRPGEPMAAISLN